MITDLSELEERQAAALSSDLEIKLQEQLGLLQGDLAGFEERLWSAWGRPLGRLVVLQGMCAEIANEINNASRSINGTASVKFEVALRLHARALQIGAEIIHLCRGGYADGAMGRWRSLHEAHVVLRFILSGDEDLAQRFVDHQHIALYKSAMVYKDCYERLEFAPLSDEQIQPLENNHTEQIGKYGVSFKNDWGWASKALGYRRVTFKDIEKSVDMDHLRVQYGFSNQFIHAGSDCLGEGLSLSLSGPDILLTGPSNEGLQEPIICASYSMISATEDLLSIASNPDHNVFVKTLWLWHDSLLTELTTAEHELKRKGNEMIEARKQVDAKNSKS